MNDNAEEKDLSRDPEMNIGNGKAIECTVKSLDLNRLLESHERTSGNDYLYEFCRAYPLSGAISKSKESSCEETSDDLTPEEACLADQMWLIGRSYAASPERYTYSRVKPNEALLESEGYESFFQDIARMLLRNKCHNENKPVAYFRGKPCMFEDDSIYEDYREKLNEKYKDLFPSKESSEELGIDDLRKAAKDACKKLSEITLPEKKDSPSNGCYEIRVTEDPSSISTVSEKDLKLAKKTANYVICFAEQLNAARILRDAAIIHRLLVNRLPKEESDDKEDSDGISLRDIAKWINLIRYKTPSVSISFCSKFLHFHYPQLFFIYDSISSKRAKAGNLYEDTFGFELKVPDGADVKKYSRAVRSWIRTDLKSDTKQKGKNTELDDSYKNRLIDYQEHVFNELVIAYAIYRYLDKGKEGTREQQEAKNKLREHLKSCTNDQDDSHEKPCIPPRYLSITRLVDELVTNSSPENMEETKETD